MSIVKKPEANYTPTLKGYSEQKTLAFHCQFVLPTVYDGSLSYYELLNKVMDSLDENPNTSNADSKYKMVNERRYL